MTALMEAFGGIGSSAKKYVLDAQFEQQIADVIAVARALHDAYVRGDFSAFDELRSTAKLAKPSRFYWDRFDASTCSTPIEEVKDNRTLASVLGISLRNADTPTCRLLYDLFEAHVGQLFHADITDGEHLGGQQSKKRKDIRRVTMYNVLRNSSWHVPVYRYFQGVKPSDVIDQRIREKSLPLRTALGEETGRALGELLYALKMILPDQRIADLTAAAMRRATVGRPLVLAGAFCPDYAYEETNDPNLPYRYTFDGLGTGIGLVAQQFARVIPPLSAFLREQGIPHRIVLGIGDFEADAESILRRVGCDYDEFVRRCSASLEAFRAAVGEGLPLELELCDADRCRGRLRPYAREATERMLRGDFGRMGEMYPDPEAVVREIIRDNGTFYKRWFGPDTTDEDVRKIVLAQGGEYAALARVYAEDFGENVVVISGDRPMMHAFDDHHAVVPTLCVKRAY